LSYNSRKTNQAASSTIQIETNLSPKKRIQNKKCREEEEEKETPSRKQNKKPKLHTHTIDQQQKEKQRNKNRTEQATQQQSTARNKQTRVRRIQ
jgi:hypothetical protein